MSHLLYVSAAYLVSALGLGGLLAWLLYDQHARRRDLAGLEAGGVRRRSRPAGEASR